MAVIYLPQQQENRQRSATQDLLAAANFGQNMYQTGLNQQKQMWDMRTGDAAFDEEAMARSGVDFTARGKGGVSSAYGGGTLGKLAPGAGGGGATVVDGIAPGTTTVDAEAAKRRMMQLDPKNPDHKMEYAMTQGLLRPSEKTVLSMRRPVDRVKFEEGMPSREITRIGQMTAGVEPDASTSATGQGDLNPVANIIQKGRGNWRVSQQELERAKKLGVATDADIAEAQQYIDDMRTGKKKFSDFDFSGTGATKQAVVPDFDNKLVEQRMRDEKKELDKISKYEAKEVEMARKKEAMAKSNERNSIVASGNPQYLQAQNDSGQYIEHQGLAEEAIREAKTYPEQMRAYNRYIQGHQNLNAHWRRNDAPASPEMLGIFKPAPGGGGRVSIEPHVVKVGDQSYNLDIPKNLTTPEQKLNYARQELGKTEGKDFAKAITFSGIKPSSKKGLLTEEQETEQTMMAKKAAEDVAKTVAKNAVGWTTFRDATKEKEIDAALLAAGGETSKMEVVPGSGGKAFRPRASAGKPTASWEAYGATSK